MHNLTVFLDFLNYYYDFERQSNHAIDWEKGKMTRKGEKRVSSTPAQNQSEVEEWTGQSPSAESWLVSQQQGSISERDKRA